MAETYLAAVLFFHSTKSAKSVREEGPDLVSYARRFFMPLQELHLDNLSKRFAQVSHRQGHYDLRIFFLRCRKAAGVFIEPGVLQLFL